uniref:7TM GPCR serpentine receptor class x (Srx) domain-containing protein n=1 Tax=Strongyloides stercoralis TaxID=6248 RepID=A0A0K0EAD6_STRER
MPFYYEVKQTTIVKIFGALTSITSFIFMIIQVLNNFIILKNRKVLFKNRIYQYIIITGFLCFFQQICHFISGIFCLTKWKPDFNIEIILGGLLNYFYNLTGLTTMALSINRGLIFFKLTRSLTLSITVFSIILTIIFIIIDTFFMILCIFFNMYIVYDLEWATWDYSAHSDSPFQNIDNKILIFANLISFLSLLAIIIKINLMKKKTTSNIKANKVTTFYIIVLISLIGLFFLIVELLWEYGGYVWPDANILLTVINFVWSLNVGKDCCINILFLKDIKKNVVTIFSKKTNIINARKIGTVVRTIKM